MLSRSSTLGGLLRDAYRFLTPAATRSRITLLLEALAYGQPDIFFVQVGSNDASYGDPLQTFVASRAWSGVMIEPVPYVFRRLQKRHGANPRLALENVAICGHDGETDFFYLAETDEPLPPWYDQLGALSSEQILKQSQAIPDLKDRIVQARVPCSTFESLCRARAIGRIDLIQIDCEGYDFEILKLIDLERHEPKVLLYEHKHLSAEDRSACLSHLRAHGYECLEDEFDTLCVRNSAVSALWSRLGRTWRLLKRSSRATAPRIAPAS